MGYKILRSHSRGLKAIFHIIGYGTSIKMQGSPFLKIFTCLTSKICFFQYQIIYDLEEKFVQIYLPDGQFYLPRAIGQWNTDSEGFNSLGLSDTYIRQSN